MQSFKFFFLTERTLSVLAKNSLFSIPRDFLFRQFVVGILFCIFVRRYFHLKISWDLDYEQSLFFLGPSSKTPETRK